ncbi:hypothetical protein PR048_010222 [Dryococelus australis]|uniref:Uncharacterized protein n=1 Tax=Dryococelus australis TaxID=614101 RepID=A0ABQ9I266_9NEOP|nr:hypothetical protein PR048_010222 [Dryococelus australis]
MYQRGVLIMCIVEHTVSVLPYVEKYVQDVKPNKKSPTCNSFKISFAADLEPFPTIFQSELFLVPFVYGSLFSIMQTVMSRFVTPEVIGSTVYVATLDLQMKANILPANKIEIGSQLTLCVLEFRQDCCNAMIVLCQKLLEQSPLKFKLTKGISCCDPAVAKQPAIRNALCDSDVFTEAVKSLQTMGKLDHFWMQNILLSFLDIQELPKFLKMIYIISHGNAALERGFSINKELVENLHGGIESVVVTKKRIHSARNAHARYVEVL